jgi:hypothetical protein
MSLLIEQGLSTKGGAREVRSNAEINYCICFARLFYRVVFVALLLKLLTTESAIF